MYSWIVDLMYVLNFFTQLELRLEDTDITGRIWQISTNLKMLGLSTLKFVSTETSEFFIMILLLLMQLKCSILKFYYRFFFLSTSPYKCVSGTECITVRYGLYTPPIFTLIVSNYLDSSFTAAKVLCSASTPSHFFNPVTPMYIPEFIWSSSSWDHNSELFT